MLMIVHFKASGLKTQVNPVVSLDIFFVKGFIILTRTIVAEIAISLSTVPRCFVTIVIRVLPHKATDNFKSILQDMVLH